MPIRSESTRVGDLSRANLAQTLAPVLALLLSVFLMLAASALQSILLPLRGAAEGFSAVTLGTLGSCYYIGFVSGCLLVPRFVRRTGHIRSFAVFASALGAVLLCQSLWITPIAWFALRCLTGLCAAGIYLVVESWLNDRATNQTRGFLISTYVMVSYAAFTAGQALLAFFPVRSFEPFVIGALLFSLAIVPISISRTPQPAPVRVPRIQPVRLLRAIPISMVSCFVIGASNGSLWSLGPIFGINRGLTNEGTAIFMSAIMVAGALPQWPIGRLGDRMDRRKVLAAVIVGAICASLALALLPASPLQLSLLGMLFGVLALPAYPLAVAHAYDQMPPEAAVETAAGILLVYGAGSVIGPSIASAAMSHFGPGALFMFMASCYLPLLLFIILMIFRSPPQSGRHRPNINVVSLPSVGVLEVTEPTSHEASELAVARRISASGMALPPAEQVELSTEDVSCSGLPSPGTRQ